MKQIINFEVKIHFENNIHQVENSWEYSGQNTDCKFRVK